MSADASFLHAYDFYRAGPEVFQQPTHELQIAEGMQNCNQIDMPLLRNCMDLTSHLRST